MRIFYILIFLFFPLILFGQSNDCVNATVVCNDGNITFNPQGAGLDDFANPNNNSGCLATGEHSSAWYYFEINAAAPPNQSLGFTINPTGGAGQDYDFALFGPDVPCSNLGNPIRCSYAGPGCAFCPQTGLGMGTTDQTEGAGGDGFVSEITVQPGQGYFLLVDNFSNNGVGFDLSWTGDAADDLNCIADPPCGLIAEAGNAATGCADGSAFSLNGSAIGNSGNETYSWVGTNGSTAYLNNPNIPNPSLTFPPNVSGTFDFTLTITDDACIDDDVVTVTINPLPVVAITPPTAICDDGNTYTISATPPGGVWSSNVPNGTVDPAVLGSGTFMVDYTYTDANGCSNMDMTTVVINPSPIVSIDPFQTQLCTNDNPVFLTASPPGGTWSPNILGGVLLPGTIGLGVWTVSYSYTDANGCDNIDEVVINIFPEPTALITDPGPLCESGDPVTLTASPTGGTWSSNATGGVFDPSNYPPGSYPVTYTYTAPFGCQTTTTIDVMVVPAPNVDISPIPVLCSDSAPYTLMANPSGGSWGPNTPGGVADPSVLGVGSHTAIYIYSDPTGCLLVASATITVEGPPNVAIVPISDLCVNGSPSTLNAAPSGGTWSLNAPSGVFDPSIGIGNYNITYSYTDPASGCSETAMTTVTVVDQPTVGITGSNSFCTGTSTTLTADAGFANYNWTGGGNTNSISVSTPGTYTVTVTDNSGCTATAEQMVIENASLTPTISGANAICDGASTTLDAGGGYISYAWSSGESSQTVLVSTPGSFTVTVTDGNGCTGTANANVSANTSPVPTISGQTSFCPGENTILDAGIFDMYAWSNATSGQTITVVAAGTYTVTVTDGNGCTGTAESIIVENTVTPPNISGNLTFCQGNNTVLDGGGSYTNYTWSNGGISQTTTISTGGNVGLTVTDGNGCASETSVMVIENSLPFPTITGPTSICTGTSTTLDAGGGFTNYVWSNTEVTNSISVSTAGTFTVTVTDNNGCTGTDQVTVDITPNLQPTITGNLSICTGVMTTLDAGGGYTNYNWSNSETTNPITTNVPGTYTVTVTDAAGCTGTDQVAVTTAPGLSPTISGNNNFCIGESTTLDAGVYDDYIWSDGSVNQTLTATANGTYTVTVSDAAGCTGVAQMIVSEFPIPVPQISGSTSFCTGTSTTLDAGTWNNYIWSNGETTSSIIVSIAGTYTVTITDGNGCTGLTFVDIIESTSLNPTIVGNLNYCPNGFTTLDAGFGFATYEWSNGGVDQTIDVTTSGDYTVTVSDASGCTGETTVFVDESVPPSANILGQNTFCTGTNTVLDAEGGYINYAWSDGSSNQTLTVTQTGTYTVTVTDTNGCTDETFVDVQELQNLDPGLSGTNVFCEGGSTVVSATGGFLTYTWSNNSMDQTIEVMQEGTYTVTVTDANGCTGSESIFIAQNDNPIPTISGDASFCPGTSTIATATPGFLTYLWSDGSTLENINVTIAGVYTVTVTDNNGCTGSAETIIDEFTSPSTTISGIPNFCPNESTTLSAGAGFSSYLWSDGTTNQDVIADQVGTYTITITDGNGCTATDEIIVSENIPPNPSIVGASSFCSGNSTTLDATGSYTNYIWSDGSTDPTLSVNQSGTYTVTVTDTNGCTGTNELAVSETTSLLPTFTGQTDFCQNESTLIEAEAGYFSYVWSDGTLTANNTITNPGTYTLTVTDANGCTGTNEISINENDPPTPTIAGSTTFCIGFSTTLDAGTFDQYLWSNASTDPTLTVSTEGVFSVTVTDGNGCTGIASTQVSESDQLEPVISGDDSFCSGNSTTLNAGAGFLSYIWSDPNNSNAQMIDVSTPGTYSVTVSDASGCTGETSIVVSENIPVNAGTANPTTALCSVDGTLINLQNELLGADPNGTWSETSANLSTGNAFDPSTASFNTNGQNPGTYTFEYFLAGPGFCPDDFEVVTIVVEQTPIAFIDQPIALDCNNPTTVLDATNSIGGTDLIYQWTLNGNTILGADSATITINSEGTYDLLVSLPNGCSATTFIEITEDFEVPEVDAGMNQQLTCQDGEATLNGSSTTPGVIYNWDGPGITPLNMNDQNPLVTSAGDYTLVVTNPQNGCESTAALVVVTADINSPVFTLDDVDPLDCNNSSQVLSAPFASNFTYQWFLNGNPIPGATIQEWEATQPGNYSLEITNTDNGCNATQSVTVDESTDPPNAEAGTADLLTCDLGTVSLNGNGSSTGNNITYEWFDPNGNPIPNSNTITIDVSQQGNYTLQVTNNDNGCTATDAVIVNADNNFPTADAGTNTNLDCDFNSIQIGGNSSTGPNFTYSWSTSNGGVITNPTSANPTINQPGTYELIVTDTDNGCSVIDAITISENTNLPVQIDYELMPISCEGKNDGSLTLLNVNGGTGPYQYSFDGGAFSSINTFPFLGEGDYSLIVTDALGCELETEVNLVAPPPFILDLGEDITIELGESAQINAIASQSYDSLWWRPEATLPCENCPNPIVSPLQTTAYQATALNFNGCEDSDDITIYVEKKRNVFIPNVFTPNDDGNNDVFIIHGGIDVEKIHVLKIFNRWGEQIFEQNDIQPNDYSVGWDGFFNGEKMNPAVFVYFAEIEFKDGQKIIYKGDVALRR